MASARRETKDALGPTPPSELAPTDEVQLARGTVDRTPFAMINRVALVIGAVVLLVLVLVVAAHLIA